MFINKIYKTEKPEALTYIGLPAMDVDGLVVGWMGGKLDGGEEWWIRRITGSAVHERLVTMRIYQNRNIQVKKLLEQTIGTAVMHCYRQLRATQVWYVEVHLRAVSALHQAACSGHVAERP
jgi:hypothetical protein